MSQLKIDICRQSCWHEIDMLRNPSRSRVAPNPRQPTYQNCGDDECSVGQWISDIIGPVFVAIRHVKPTVGVPNPNLYRTQYIRGCWLSAMAFMLKRDPFYLRNRHKSSASGARTPGQHRGSYYMWEYEIMEEWVWKEQKIYTTWGGHGKVFLFWIYKYQFFFKI